MIKFSRFHVFCIFTCCTLLLLNAQTGKSGKYNWLTIQEQKDKLVVAAAMVIANVEPATIAKFGKEEYARVKSLLVVGADKREIEGIVGQGKDEEGTNIVRYQAQNGRTLKIEYGEDGALIKVCWEDECSKNNKPQPQNRNIL